ncbi:MAG TPA: type II toxin-antitoxin system ParD family antitoxin [Tepidisphaeraceae bacterium]|nr:type II toxin-antitoxin system ParD family antitoxin [Tepidisphaeraceae bacterium]
MTISLSPELQRFVEEQVRSGRFVTADAAVAEAVRQMKEREEKLVSLRQQIQVGLDELDRGQGEPWDVEVMKADLRRKHGRI